MSIPLGVPVEIDGQDVIIARDVIGTEALGHTRENEVFTEVEGIGEDGRPPIFINENELGRLRNAYPGVPVYGLWQLLFANDKVTLGEELIIYPTGQNSGIYLRLNPNADLYSPASILDSSEYKDNYIADLPGQPMDKAIRLSVGTAGLSLPETPAYTRHEKYEKDRQITQRRWVIVGGICVAVMLTAAAINYALFSIHTMKLKAFQSKQLELQTLATRMAELERTRLMVHPNDSLVLDRIRDLVDYDPGLRSPTTGDFGVPEGLSTNFTNELQMFVTSPNISTDLATVYPWAKTAKTPHGTYVLSFDRYSEEGSH